jgi:tetratricopeptide (TPR) repeat protein
MKHLPSPDMNTFNILFQLANVEEKLEKLEAAFAHVREALQQLVQLVPGGHPLLQHVQMYATSLQQRLAPTSSSAAGGTTADQLSQQGVALALQGRLAEAVTLYDQSLAKQANPLVMYNAAWALCQLPDQLDRAVQYYGSALTLAQQLAGRMVFMIVSELKKESKPGCRKLLAHPTVVQLHRQLGQ